MRMPFMVSRMKASATVTSDGNSFGGNTPASATISHRPSTTTNGNALRAITRQRAFSLDAAERGRVSAAISAMRDNRAILRTPTSDNEQGLSAHVPGTAQHEAQRSGAL